MNNLIPNIADTDTSLQVDPDLAEKIIPVDTGALTKFLEELPGKLIRFGAKLAIAIILLIVGLYLIKLVRKVLKKSLTKANAEHGVITFLDSLVKIVLFALLLILIAAYFGFSIAGLITILGTALVAVALSLKDNLSNIAGGVIILLTKPFRIGDYIRLGSGGIEGTVVEISIFYTKLCTFDNNAVVLPNGSLSTTSIVNLSTNPTRRVDMTVGISYSADIVKAKEVLNTIIRKDAAVLVDKGVDVFVDDLADSSVNLGIHFHVNNADFWSAKWRVLEAIKLGFDENGISIPFPQVDVHMDGRK